MKKVESLTKNKGLINTFNKFKVRFVLNKQISKELSFFFSKFKKSAFNKTLLKNKSLNLKKSKFFFSKFKKSAFNKTLLKNKSLNLKKSKIFFLLKLTIMFIKYIFIKKVRPLTNSKRFKTIMFNFKFRCITKHFNIFIKNTSGRNNQGRITSFSKGKSFKKLTYISTLQYRWDNKLFTSISIFRNNIKLYNLCKHTQGSFTTQPYIHGSNIGQYMFVSNLPQKFWKNNLPGSLVCLKFLEKNAILSNVFLKNINMFATSNGTFCQVLDYFYDFNLIKLSLPSKNVKIISGWNFAYIGRNSQIDFKFTRLTKAGTLKTFGAKSKVRGVARNPVDHPHGGRTKTNKPEVSIWGWIAKKNK